tara:strand:+ start:293 stop:496 length:204 start_codon:yes stop_codon:yes gene_type:complete
MSIKTKEEKEAMKTFELWYTLPAFGCSRPIDSVSAKDKIEARRKLKKKRNFKNTETEIYSIHEAREA